MISDIGETSQAVITVGHRGCPSLLPENTLQSLIFAAFTSDLIQFDVALTKDQEVIIFHDRGLKRITNVHQFSQFKDRLKTQTIDYYHKEQTDWWLREFTKKQLNRLKIFQSHKNRPQPKKQHHFYILNFEQFLLKWMEIYKKYHKEYRIGGLLIQLKEQVADEQVPSDRLLVEKVCSILKKYQLDDPKKSEFPKIILQSFYIPMLRYISTKNQIILLYDQHIKITRQLLNQDKQQLCIGIGISQGNLKTAQNEETVKSICQSSGLLIFYWGISDDSEVKHFNAQSNEEVYHKLKNLGVIGFITDFPQSCQKYLKNNTINTQKLLNMLGYDSIFL